MTDQPATAATDGATAACTGKWAPHHIPSVYYTRRLRDGLRKSFWVVCRDCDLKFGPFDRGFARFVEADLNA